MFTLAAGPGHDSNEAITTFLFKKLGVITEVFCVC